MWCRSIKGGVISDVRPRCFVKTLQLGTRRILLPLYPVAPTLEDGTALVVELWLESRNSLMRGCQQKQSGRKDWAFFLNIAVHVSQ